MTGFNEGLTAREVAQEIAKMRHLPTKSNEQRKIVSSERRRELKRLLDDRTYKEEIKALESGDIGGFTLIKVEHKFITENQKRKAAKQARKNRKLMNTDFRIN